ncbi:unnamed protein product [Trichogramma brassicae]|uniref:Uncharacterized protein n=1 Tax=Trichogramma brassicae TaxID=86971 RepID=A0A6H5I2Q9_9HYME|nr:unnamed protein product [Trichogramma brassicae]
MSTSKHISDKNDVPVGHNQDKLVKLRSMREKVNEKIERERQEFIRELEELICDWKDQLPDLRDTFGREEVDQLLYVCATSVISYHGRETERFVDFVIRTGYKDKPEIDEITGKPLSRRTTPVHWAARLKHNLKLVGQFFEIYNRFDVNYIDELGVSHFHIACENGLYDVVKKFLELGQDPNCLPRESNASSVDPPLHLALKYRHKAIIELLLRNGANPNLVNKEGLTLLQIISMQDIPEDVARIIFEMTHDKYLPVRVDVGHDSGNTPLHVALKRNKKELAALLLRNGANPSLANEEGCFPLHLICMGSGDDDDLAKILFEVSDEVDRPVQVDVQSHSGWTPLLWTVRGRRKKLFEILLRRGADPNVANANGLTPLHLICNRWYDGNDDDSQWAKMLFEISNENHMSVQVDARDSRGDAPLHEALFNGQASMTELLLRKGADPNVANANGLTPLHVICQKVHSGDLLAELFFKICDERHLQVQVNAVDESGRTPLQLAVAYFLPDAVDLLLDRGADLSSFVFPPSNHIVLTNFAWFHTDESCFNLTSASRALIVIENLEIRGYDLDRSGAITIMNFFDKNRLFEKSPNLEQRWYEHELFAIDAKKEMIKPNLSLNDLIQLRPEKARKLLSYQDFYEFGRSHQSIKFSKRHWQVCAVHLCEMMSRGFFRRWALESFSELTQYRLPILCCRMIIEQLSNKNLYHICLATTIQSSSRSRVCMRAPTFSLCRRSSRAVEASLEYLACDSPRLFVRQYRASSEKLMNEVMPLQDELDEKIFIDFECEDVKPELPSSSTSLCKTDAIKTMSNDKVDVYGGAGGWYDLDYELEYHRKASESAQNSIDIPKFVNHSNITLHLLKLKKIRETIVRVFGQDRGDLIRQLGRLIEKWQGQYPDLKKLLRREEIDWLLVQCVDSKMEYELVSVASSVLKFVVESGYKDELRLDEGSGEPLLRRRTPVHLVSHFASHFLPHLFKIYDRFDVNYIDEDGLTHFHVACEHGFEDVVVKFLELGQVDPNCLVEKTGDSPLHLSVKCQKKVTRLLLGRGANPNSVNAKGETPLHNASKGREHEHELAKMLFELSHVRYRPVLIDARDHEGNTPLHWALLRGCKSLAKFLLRNGAGLNLANNEGDTNLHLALRAHGYDPKEVLESLLRRGADPTLANEKGETPLHVVCQQVNSCNFLAEVFFKLCDEQRRVVRVDARDKLGRTPLQWAVASILVDAVDLLLDRGADMSRFVFPSDDYFGEGMKYWKNDFMEYSGLLRRASAALIIVERLEKRGYRLVRSDATTIMKFFDQHKMFEKSPDIERCWHEDENFANVIKRIWIKRGLSFHDLILSQPEEAKKLFTLKDYYDFAHNRETWMYAYWHIEACALRLCEMLVSREFFLRWALDSFMELTRYRLPILCCELIIEELTNQDLCYICLAAARPSRKDSEANAKHNESADARRRRITASSIRLLSTHMWRSSSSSSLILLGQHQQQQDGINPRCHIASILTLGFPRGGGGGARYTLRTTIAHVNPDALRNDLFRCATCAHGEQQQQLRASSSTASSSSSCKKSKLSSEKERDCRAIVPRMKEHIQRSPRSLSRPTSESHLNGCCIQLLPCVKLKLSRAYIHTHTQFELLRVCIYCTRYVRVSATIRTKASRMDPIVSAPPQARADKSLEILQVCQFRGYIYADELHSLLRSFFFEPEYIQEQKIYRYKVPRHLMLAVLYIEVRAQCKQTTALIYTDSMRSLFLHPQQQWHVVCLRIHL